MATERARGLGLATRHVQQRVAGGGRHKIAFYFTFIARFPRLNPADFLGRVPEPGPLQSFQDPEQDDSEERV